MKINTGLDNKRVILNMFFSCVAYMVNAFISLFITPYITSNLGAEAYGFVKLANDCIAYGSLVTLALNSMSSRFIMLSREAGDEEEARSFYSSITIANITMAIILLLPTLVLIFKITDIFNVPVEMITEVRWTFVWTFSNFIICLAGTTFGNCFFLENRLNISSILTSVTSILRAIFIIIVFATKGPKISIIAFGSIVVTLVYMPCNIIFHRRLTPDLYFDYKLFKWEKVIKVITSGIWNSITKLSQILTTGLDLMISNLLLGALEMGYLSVAKTIPNFISALINAVGNSFTPNMMQLYAQNNQTNLRIAIKTSMKIMSVFSTVSNAILVTMGLSFYKLWLPSQPVELINRLSIITTLGICVLGPMQPLYQVFTLTNKIRQSSLVFIVEGIISIVLTMICVKQLRMGIFAIAGVSVLLSIIVALVYHLPMAAIYLQLPWNTFYPEICKTMIIFIMQCAIGYIIDCVLVLEKSWGMFFLGIIIHGCLGLIISVLGLLNRDEREMLLAKILKKKVERKNE